MDCSDREALAQTYDRNIRNYSALLRALSALAKDSSHPDWELAWHNADEARKLCDISQAFLKKHVAEHRC